MTNKVIDSGISVDHVNDWTVGMAMRELVQNWLDVKNEFSVGGTISYKDGLAIIKDNGPGLEVKHLAFGMSDKSEESVGQFGEGLKSAFLVLARNHIWVEIRSSGFVITPDIQMSNNFGTDTLHYHVEPMEARFAARLKGTKVLVECSQNQLDEGKSYFVELAKSNGKFNWLDKGKISLPGGTIYIKGSAIAQVEGMKFSYHLTGERAADAINRDRSSLDMDRIEPMIGWLIGRTGSTKVMEEMLSDLMGSQSNWEIRLFDHVHNAHRSPKVWMRVWNRMFGKKYVLSGSQDREAQYRGWQILEHIDWSLNRFLQGIGVQTSSDVVHVRVTKPRFGKVGVRSLNTVEKENLNFARRMTKKHYADPGKVIICTNPGALMGEQHSSYNGIYDGQKDITYINRGALQNLETALHTMLHETVHKVTGTKDCTSEFERALLNVAVQMIRVKAKR